MNRRPSPIEAARRRHRLAEVVARTGIWISATAGSVTVRCPMPSHGHPDRTPSLRLFLDDDTWYCFGCSARAGDVVQWVTQTEGVDWRQAIRILDSGLPLTNAWTAAGDRPRNHRAEAAGTAELPDLERTPPARIREVLDATWAHCTTGPRRARAVAYLARRGIDVTVLESYTGRHEAGHTPQYGTPLATRLLSEGFTTEELVDAGLVHRYSDGGLSDFYRDRVLIPIRDDQGRLAGLIGRNVGDSRWPKYKNPPRTAVYDKSVDLYQPLPATRHPDCRVIVVEGTLDALAIACAAVKARAAHYFCPITQSGRELSAPQLRRVIGLPVGPPVLAFDADPAGRDSACRYAAAARVQGSELAVAALPEGHDPASWLAAQGPRGLAVFMSALPETGKPTDPTVASTAVPASDMVGGAGI